MIHESIDSIEELTNSEYKKIEKEADSFAGFFLLPKDSFGEDIKLFPTKLEYYKELKVKWKVSIASMNVRVKQLEIINDEQYINLYRALSRKRWRKEEPYDRLTPQIQPNAFKEAFDLLFDEGIYDADSFFEEFSKYSDKPLNFDELEKNIRIFRGVLC